MEIQCDLVQIRSECQVTNSSVKVRQHSLFFRQMFLLISLVSHTVNSAPQPQCSATQPNQPRLWARFPYTHFASNQIKSNQNPPTPKTQTTLCVSIDSVRNSVDHYGDSGRAGPAKPRRAEKHFRWRPGEPVGLCRGRPKYNPRVTIPRSAVCAET